MIPISEIRIEVVNILGKSGSEDLLDLLMMLYKTPIQRLKLAY